MALRWVGSLVRGGMRARSCSSSPGTLVQRNCCFHFDGHASPAAAAAAAAAAVSSSAGSHGLLNSRMAVHSGSHVGGGRGFPGGGDGIILTVTALTALASFFFFRSGISREEDDSLPERVDWSQMGAVTVPKHQRPCGNCWAHATVGAVEGSYQIETGQLVELSAQQLTDCAWFADCKGGTLISGFVFALSGITTAASYPQRLDMWHGKCCSEGITPAVKICRFSFTDGTEMGLKRAVAKQPVAICLDNVRFLKGYTGGIVDYDDSPKVGDPDSMHAVLVVGYDTDEFGVKFWNVKNSWGSHWGEGGYFRMRRYDSTECAVHSIGKTCGIYPHMSWFS